MTADSGNARPVDLVGALGTVLGAAALHFVIARALFAVQGGQARFGTAAREAIDLGIAASGAALLLALYVRARTERTALLARDLPLLLVGVSSVATLIGWWQLGPTPLRLTTPAAVAAFSSSLATALLLAILVRGVARQMTARGTLLPFDAVAPPQLAFVYAGLAAAVVLAVHLAVLPQLAADAPVQLAAGLVAAGLTLMLAVAAGATTGTTVGASVTSLARRLEGLSRGPASADSEPIVPAELDQLGDLLVELERLRSRLENEQRLYQDALERTRAADAAKADFLSVVSHELRTPLHTVGGYAQLLLSGEPAPLTDAQAEDVRLIQAGGRQLFELVNDILDVSMIESGELRLSFAATDIGALVTEIVRSHQPLVRDREIELSAHIGELPKVVCDRRRIVQIVTNLVSNAVKFTEKGRIELRAEASDTGESVAISCRDTGVGIAREEVEMIFEAYQQAGTISRRKKGTGLGLAIARSIAAAHGGRLRVESELGRGSSFTLTLPVDPPRRPAAIDIAEEAARAVVRRRHHDTQETLPR